MVENVLLKRQASLQVKVTVKVVLSMLLAAMAVILPQLVHLAAGPGAGMRYLPMYLPVLLGGCLLGSAWGIGVGMISPLVSFFITSLAGSPMPAAQRLPFMMAELAVFALITGLFSRKIVSNPRMAFPAVFLACLGGRSFFLLSVWAFRKAASLAPAVVWGQIRSGFVGLAIQMILVPLLVMGLEYLLDKRGE